MSKDAIDRFYAEWATHKTNCKICAAVLLKNLRENRDFDDYIHEFCSTWVKKWRDWVKMWP